MTDAGRDNIQFTSTVRSTWGACRGVLSRERGAVASLVQIAGRVFRAKFTDESRVGGTRDPRKGQAQVKAGLDILLRAMASLCERDAEDGLFHKPGLRCGSCLHGVPGGCRLRILSGVAAE